MGESCPENSVIDTQFVKDGFILFSELGFFLDKIKQVHMDYPISMLQQVICCHHIFGIVIPDQLKRSVFAIFCCLA